VEKLVDDSRRERLHRLSLRVAELPEPRLGATQLRFPNLVGARAQRCDRRHDIERRVPRPERVRLPLDDPLCTLRLTPPHGERLRDDSLEVVDVVQVAAVEGEADAFRAWHASLDVVPAIASLRAHADEIREAELRRAESRLGQLSDAQRQAVEALASRIIDKLLHLPTVRMKQAAAAADGVVYAEAVRHLFGLGEDER
jgi:hypothetical protein